MENLSKLDIIKGFRSTVNIPTASMQHATNIVNNHHVVNGVCI